VITEKSAMSKTKGDPAQENESAQDAGSRFESDRAELFEAIGHETRIRILQILSESPAGFSELKRRAEIESSGNLSFHLGKLGDLIKTDSHGDYALTDDGKDAVRVIETSIQSGVSTRFGHGKVSIKFNLGIIAISIVWAAMMLVVSFIVRGDAGLGTNLLMVEIGGFIASLSILSWLGRAG